MECKCPSCTSTLVKRNGRTHNGKQNYRCLACDRQFVLDPTQKIIEESIKSLIRKTLLERAPWKEYVASLKSVCHGYWRSLIA